MGRERISGVDTAWLRMEQPHNLMMIVGVLTFKDRVSRKRLEQVVDAGFLSYRRFRQRTTQDATGAYWEDVEDFSLTDHVSEHTLPSPGGKVELEKLVSEIASTPLDFSRPLWHFHLVHGFGLGTAVVSRIHHCYADGIALIQVTLSMTAPTAAESIAIKAERADPPAADADEQDLWQQVIKPIAGTLDWVGANVEKFGAQAAQALPQGLAALSNPAEAAGMATTMARELAVGTAIRGVGILSELGRLATMSKDSPTSLKGELGTSKRVAWIEPLSLELVKAMGKAFGASINDVLLALAAGALRQHLSKLGNDVDGICIRATVPVNLRPLNETGKLGNRFGLVFVELPVGIDHPLERLYEVKHRMQELKGSYQPVIALALLSVVGYGPRVLQEQISGMLSQNASLVMTNVPGPQQALYFAGCQIDEINFWVPQSGAIGLGLSILSYNGRIQFGVIADTNLIEDPDSLAQAFRDQFETLLWLTLMSPWGGAGNTPGKPASAPGKPASAPPKRRKALKRMRSTA